MNRIKSILFNTDMVRASLDGRKSVIRRVIKPQPIYSVQDGFSWKGFAYGTDLPSTVKGAAHNFVCACPYKPGDILYVRETWNYGYIECSDISDSSEVWFEPVYKSDGHGSYIEALSHYFYKADEDAPGSDIGMVWRPSIYMPKEAARIWLKVTDVRVEQLQDITNKDVEKEGVEKKCIDSYIRQMPYETEEYIRLAHIIALQDIWDSTIKKKDLQLYGWNANPWVWVIEFEQCEKPEE
ncbi:hypothetical protein H8S37_04215 [Mediterraneibacter sp. NSJ-55]|uniref:Morphogenetic protein n=1 Tax=Mediterraneibacter hominis TaxID=2763054 RepID=A0A923LG68_9FIRM|nr:hypothetical protein [Mediterraneibacter hominis]MBC5688138.1 hypothetical protein [Mediterraneibacter hominis]